MFTIEFTITFLITRSPFKSSIPLCSVSLPGYATFFGLAHWLRGSPFKYYVPSGVPTMAYLPLN